MTITVAEEAMFEVLGSVGSDEELIDGAPLTERHVRNVTIGMARNQDEPFVRLVLEQTLKDGRWQDYMRLSGMFEEELEPVFAELYRTIWGPLPEGPAPRIRYVSCWNDPSAPPHRGEPVVRSFDREVWFRAREELYGLPPYDYEELRRRALE